MQLTLQSQLRSRDKPVPIFGLTPHYVLCATRCTFINLSLQYQFMPGESISAAKQRARRWYHIALFSQMFLQAVFLLAILIFKRQFS